MGIPEITAAQRAYFMTGATRPEAFRRDMLQRLQNAIQANERRIAEAVEEDLGKQPFETYMCETGLVLDEIRYHLKHLHGWMKPRRVRTPLAQFPSRSFLLPEPYGVALIMTPWNYPVQLCLEPLVGAISGGNCALLKPSIYALNTSHIIADIIGKTFPPEYIAVVEGGRAENSALFEEKFDYLFFTGSVNVGKVAMTAAAKHLTPVTLELGGKSPVIVDATADMALAAKRVAFGKILNAGQTCVGPDYVLIEESARDAFLAAFRAALDEFFPGGDMSAMPHIIAEKHYLEKKELLKGQTIAIGGGFDDKRLFIEPTVLIDVSPDSPVMQEEIFAPILPVLTWKTPSEATDFIRSRAKPLALYLFTRDKAMERRVFRQCSFGGGCVNDTVIHLATSYMGFGGVGESGMGRYHGKASFETFSHMRSIVKKSYRFDLPIRYHPYTKEKERLLHRFLK